MKKIFAFVAPVLISACSGGGGGSGAASNLGTAAPPSTTVTSQDVQFTPVTVKSCSQSDWSVMTAGDYGVTNNLWGKGTITNFNQCIEATTSGTVVNGAPVQKGLAGHWTWDWPANSDFTVKSYAEFMYRPDKGSLTPIPLSNVDNVTMSHDVTISATGDYNLAYDLWIDATKGLNQWPHKAELMIKPVATWKDAPIIDTLTVDGVVYDVSIGRSYNDQWAFISFSSQAPISKAKIRLKPFVDYLVAKGTISTSDYLSSIEFGSELVRGAGIVTVNSYSVTR